MISIDEIKAQYPLHYLIWTNHYKELEEELSKRVVIIDNLIKGNLLSFLINEIIYHSA